MKFSQLGPCHRRCDHAKFGNNDAYPSEHNFEIEFEGQRQSSATLRD